MDSSDDKRRSMKDTLSDEARRFLKPDTEARADKAKTAQPIPGELDEREPAANPPTPDLHHTTMAMKTTPHLSVVIPAIVSMTFRLPASLAAQLVGVATERKLQRQRPFTQQDIVAEALRQWFLRNGYVDPRGG